jgi:hypothetical protein
MNWLEGFVIAPTNPPLDPDTKIFSQQFLPSILRIPVQVLDVIISF